MDGEVVEQHERAEERGVRDEGRGQQWPSADQERHGPHDQGEQGEERRATIARPVAGRRDPQEPERVLPFEGAEDPVPAVRERRRHPSRDVHGVAGGEQAHRQSGQDEQRDTDGHEHNETGTHPVAQPRARGGGFRLAHAGAPASTTRG